MNVNENTSIAPLTTSVEAMLKNRKMNPIVPMPPNSPFFGIIVQGPFSKKLAMPLAADVNEVNKVAKNNGLSSKSNRLCPLINPGFCPQRQSKMCICGTLSIRGSEMMVQFRMKSSSIDNTFFSKTYQGHPHFVGDFLFPLSNLHLFSRIQCKLHSTFSTGDKIVEGPERM